MKHSFYMEKGAPLLMTCMGIQNEKMLNKGVKMDFIKFKKIKRENRKENKLFIIRYDINKNISNTYYIRNFTFEKKQII